MRELIKNCTPVKTIAIRNSALLRFIFNQTSSESSVSIDGTESPPSVWVSMKVGTGGADGFTFGAYNKKIIDICEGEITIDPDLPPSREVFFVASDGYLYRDEVSCVADNEELKSSIDTAVLLARSPQMVKHWQEMYLIAECVTGGDVEVTVSYHDETGYRRSAPSRSVELSTGVIYWDTIDWDYANWDTIGHNKVRVKLSGLGDAISFGMTSSKFLQDPDYYKALQINFIPTESRRHR
jgi:hypothetical protein